MSDETFDVVVVGFGFAGGITALNVAKSGAKTFLLEKAAVPGGSRSALIKLCAARATLSGLSSI